MQINKKNKLEELKKKIDKIESSKNKTIIKKRKVALDSVSKLVLKLLQH